MMKKMLSTALMAVTVSALALSGCAKKEETKPAASATPATSAAATASAAPSNNSGKDF